ncbi:hypothetical protein AX15_007094 [Amanita polypyramis BW_CC]|nr:hypothetical protein AX15_007094 [Amanita polypyramis BW_CC]
MATTNPSHILIARNSRSSTNPSASLSSPTETHAAASGIFRSTGSPPWLLEEHEIDSHLSSLNSDDDDEEAIEVDETFTRHSQFPGSIKIVVESTTFWAHKEVLYFASPFFQAAFSGNWSETGRPLSMSSVITIPQLHSDPHGDPECSTANQNTVHDSVEAGSDEPDVSVNSALRETCTQVSDLRPKRQVDSGDLASVQQLSKYSKERPDAVIVLKEEKANIFHDLLKFVYPHLECTITWNNVEGLMNISHKLCVPALQRECLTFLLTHAAGKPIKALRIAEMFEEEELYREASRFVLDNPGGWSEQELNTLSKETLLKLEKRYFLYFAIETCGLWDADTDAIGSWSVFSNWDLP